MEVSQVLWVNQAGAHNQQDIGIGFAPKLDTSNYDETARISDKEAMINAPCRATGSVPAGISPRTALQAACGREIRVLKKQKRQDQEQDSNKILFSGFIAEPR